MNALLLEILAAPFVLCLVLTGLHAYVGFHVLARGVLFVDLALAQVAAMGSTAALLVGFDHDSPGAYVFALGATFLGAALFAATRAAERKVSQEAIIGIVYAVSAAVALLLVDRAPHGTEHVKEILVGNLLAVSWRDVLMDAPVYVALGLFHFALRRRFLTISFQPTEAAARGWRIARWDLLFYMAFGLMITTSVRIAGVLLVFSYLIVPGVMASLWAERLSRRLVFAWVAGGVVTLLGMWASVAWDFPTGASIVAVFGAALALLALSRLLLRREGLVAALALAALSAGSAQAADGDRPASFARDAGTDASTDVDLEALQRALMGSQPAVQPPEPTSAAAPPPASSVALLNPAVSAVFNVAGAWYQGEPPALSHTDPRATGLSQQEIELAVQAVADPYVRGDLFVSMVGRSEFEVEEAFLTSLSLPLGLQAKAGLFRSILGRQNQQHLEQLSFVNRPLLNPALLPEDGLRAPGAQLSILFPFLPFYSALYAEAFSVRLPEHAGGEEHAGEEEAPLLQTFGGGAGPQLAVVAAWKNFFDLSDEWSLLVGLAGATGTSPGADLDSSDDDLRSWLLGGDLYLKWRPLGAGALDAGIAVTAEYFVRRLPGGDTTAGYAQVVAQLARRWAIAARAELVTDLVHPGEEPKTMARGSLALTFRPSEFTRLRMQVDRGFFDADDTAYFVQLGGSIGPHGAHPF